MKTFIKSIYAGAMIAIGALCYMKSPNIIGAVLFSVGLSLVIKFGFSLYTGKVGLAKSKYEYFMLPIIFIGNCIGTSIAFIGNTETAVSIMNNKLSASWYEVFIKAVICGVLIYFAVSQKDNFITTLSVTAFIMCGAEHSVANICYMFATKEFNVMYVWFTIIVFIGNAVGSMAISHFVKPNKVRL